MDNSIPLGPKEKWGAQRPNGRLPFERYSSEEMMNRLGRCADISTYLGFDKGRATIVVRLRRTVQRGVLVISFSYDRLDSRRTVALRALECRRQLRQAVAKETSRCSSID